MNMTQILPSWSFQNNTSQYNKCHDTSQRVVNATKNKYYKVKLHHITSIWKYISFYFPINVYLVCISSSFPSYCKTLLLISYLKEIYLKDSVCSTHVKPCVHVNCNNCLFVCLSPSLKFLEGRKYFFKLCIAQPVIVSDI